MSIRWKMLLTFLLILGTSFAAMAALLTGLVSSTLYAQRTRQVSLSAEKLAATAAPFFAAARLDALEETLHAAAADVEGRILLLDASGKIQLDTLSLLEGTRSSTPEAIAVLSGTEGLSYGIHPLEGTDEYAALCAAPMTENGRIIGAVLLSTPVTELRGAIQAVERQLMTVFIAVAAAALIAALIFALTLTAPIKALTTTIRRMGRGDLSARVNVHASGELKALADSYNAMAEKIEHFDQSRSQFVQNASHELKTPLATMKLLLENLIYQPDMPSELRAEFMQDMNHEIDRLSGIITDLLTLTQMDGQTAALKLDNIDLSALCEETLHALHPAADKANVKLCGDIEESVALPGDESKLSQVVYNLIDNAIKYTGEGGEVTVTLRADSRAATLEVKDNGIGIPEEDVKHIFDRFYRVDKARSRATGGTGLGLSIVRQMVQLHGGEVHVASTAGQGSVFTVTLPMRREDA
ncbi:MAG: HAMP domain-containing sensor histidine kinase [Clostridiales bacterium]|nr:HAMP domain-containing sensor histidine kinase [Clostridiales bacterium]